MKPLRRTAYVTLFSITALTACSSSVPDAPDNIFPVERQTAETGKFCSKEQGFKIAGLSISDVHDIARSDGSFSQGRDIMMAFVGSDGGIRGEKVTMRLEDGTWRDAGGAMLRPYPNPSSLSDAAQHPDETGTNARHIQAALSACGY